ncbi:MAG: hypothetical protein ACLFTE_04195 [Salinivenus sp.]
MDDRLRFIQYLYDEDDAAVAPQRGRGEDASLYREYEALRETKEALDRRPARSPDPKVVDRVVARAAAAAQSTSQQATSANRAPAPNRPPRASEARWTRRLQGISAAIAVVLMAGIGWWAVSGDLDDEGAAPSTVANAPSQPAAEGASGDEQAIPAWDGRDELIRLHSRIERLQSQSQIETWDGGLQPVQSRP